MKNGLLSYSFIYVAVINTTLLSLIWFGPPNLRMFWHGAIFGVFVMTFIDFMLARARYKESERKLREHMESFKVLLREGK